ncbi:MAG: hypothetical protein OSB62_03985 [Alphaproteobacteria bacterium]|jgi:hypothetical protein|nr:hypothetical protein [Alphaproteobacteria bacterium]
MRILLTLSFLMASAGAFAMEPIEGYPIEGDSIDTDPVMDIMSLNEISPAAGLGNSIQPGRPRSKEDAKSLYFDLKSVSGEGDF